MIADFAETWNTGKVHKIMSTFLVKIPIILLLTFQLKSAWEKSVSEWLQNENSQVTDPRRPEERFREAAICS